jgi:hypothetical protein
LFIEFHVVGDDMTEEQLQNGGDPSREKAGMLVLEDFEKEFDRAQAKNGNPELFQDDFLSSPGASDIEKSEDGDMEGDSAFDFQAKTTEYRVIDKLGEEQPPGGNQ